jgi:type IV pilus assembly protein PilC
MAEFTCRVATSAGEIFERSYVFDNEAALRRELESQDLMILDLQRRSAFLRQLARSFRLGGNISSREFLVFNQEFGALIRAGLPVVQSLTILLERRKNPTFKQALLDVRDRVKAGEQLSEAFAAQSDLFPRLYTASLASGERTGELGTVIKRFVDYLQRSVSMQRKVLSAMIYPVILLVLSCVVIAVMIFFIIPKFNEFLKDFGADLPLLSKVIVGFALFCTGHWQIIVGGGVTALITFMFWSRTMQGRETIDRIKLGLPLAGGVIRNYCQNRFTRTLATLQAGGLPLVTSLELSARSVSNAVFERRLLQVAAEVREGKALWETLEKTELLSDIAIQMIKVGESTGALVEMLNDASDFTDEEIDTQLTRLVSLVEPMMLVFMAVVVAVMLLSIYLPLLQAYGQSQG